jgi:hypothetical protein
MKNKYEQEVKNVVKEVEKILKENAKSRDIQILIHLSVGEVGTVNYIVGDKLII